MNHLLNKLGSHLFTVTVAMAAVCSAGLGAFGATAMASSTQNAVSMNPNTIILPSAADPHTSSVPIGTVLPDGSIYEGLASGTDLTGTWDWCYTGAPTDYYNGCAVAGYPNGIRLAGQTISVTGTDLEGHRNTTELYGACYPFSEDQQPWTTTLRLDTTAFKNGSKIVLTFDQDGYQTLGGVPVGNVYGVSSESWSWTVYNNFFAGGNKDFDRDVHQQNVPPDETQEALVDTLSFGMFDIGYLLAPSPEEAGFIWDGDTLNCDVEDIENIISSATVFYMSSHGQVDSIGDSLALEDGSESDYLGSNDVAKAIQAKGHDLPPMSFAFCDSCFTMENTGTTQNPDNNMAEAFLNGAVSGSPPQSPLNASAVPDRAATGWQTFVDPSTGVDFAESLFRYLDAGYTLHQAIKDSCFLHPVYEVQNNWFWGTPDRGAKAKPETYGDEWMTLRGVYGGNPDMRDLPGLPWYNLITGPPDKSPVTTATCSTAGLQ